MRRSVAAKAPRNCRNSATLWYEYISIRPPRIPVFSIPIAGMTSADTSAASFDTAPAEEPRRWSVRRWLAPLAVAMALLSAFLTFLVLTGLTTDRADAGGGPLVLSDQCGHDPAAGRDHRPRALAADPGAAAGPGGGAPPCPDRQPVLDRGGAAGGAGRRRRQRHHRARPRPAVLRPDQGGDPEFADDRAGLHAGPRAADPRRHSRHGQRHRATPGRSTTRTAARSASC